VHTPHVKNQNTKCQKFSCQTFVTTARPLDIFTIEIYADHFYHWIGFFITVLSKFRHFSRSSLSIVILSRTLMISFHRTVATLSILMFYIFTLLDFCSLLNLYCIWNLIIISKLSFPLVMWQEVVILPQNHTRIHPMKYLLHLVIAS